MIATECLQPERGLKKQTYLFSHDDRDEKVFFKKVTSIRLLAWNERTQQVLMYLVHSCAELISNQNGDSFEKLHIHNSLVGGYPGLNSSLT